MKYLENHRPVTQQEFFSIIRSFGFEVVSTVMTNQRTGQCWQHDCVIQPRNQVRSQPKSKWDRSYV